MEEVEGNLHVFGKATGPDLDLDGQIIDPDFARKAMGEWFEGWGNVRQMHNTKSLPPAGRALELSVDGDDHWLTAKVVEPGAIKLTREGVYQAFSVGISNPRIIRDASAPNGRIVGGVISEVSLVDRPANPTCKFMVAKGAGFENDETATLAPEWEDVGEAVELAAETDVAKADSAQTDEERATAGGRTVTGDGDENDEAEDDRQEGKAADAEVEKRDFSKDERDAMAKDGRAMPDGSFPIDSAQDVENAVHDWGRAGSDAKVKAHIIRRAKAIGATDKLPADWSGSTKEDDGEKAAGPDLAKLQELHDLLCPHTDAAEAITKALGTDVEKNGLAAAIGPQAMQIVWQMLQHEVEEDGGNGSECWDICNIAKTYADLAGFVQSETWQMLSDLVYGDDGGVVLMAARPTVAKVHDSLAGAFPELCSNPPAAEKSTGAELVMKPVEDPVAAAAEAEAKLTGAAPELTPEGVAAGEVQQDEPGAEEAPKAAEADLVKRLDDQQALIEELNAKLEKMAGEPDPAQAPFRGGSAAIVRPHDEAEAAPAGESEEATKAAEAELTKRREAHYDTFLENIAANHPDPSLRFKALVQLDERRQAAASA